MDEAKSKAPEAHSVDFRGHSVDLGVLQAGLDRWEQAAEVVVEALVAELVEEMYAKRC